MRPLRHLVLCLLATLVLPCACDDDEATLAPYRQDLADVRTDGDGATTELLRDDGYVLPVQNKRRGYVRDTLYRMRVLYTEQEGSAILSALVPVLSPLPKAYREEAVRTDPVTTVALWRGGRYVNFRLNIKSANGTHYFGFIDRGRRQNSDGSFTQSVELLHNQNGDPLHYTREVYLSCPLFGFEEPLQAQRDSVEVTLQDFSGKQVRRFPY